MAASEQPKTKRSTEPVHTMQLLYISNGNIPSRWAHTVQIMKMSEAFAELVPDFRLLIPGGLLGSMPPHDIFDWYGISRPFRLSRLPMAWRLAPSMLDRSNWRRFSARARIYTWAARPRLIMTRCHESADFALRDGFRVIFETHDGPGHPKTMDAIAAFARRPTLVGVVTTSDVLKEAFCEAGLRPDQVLAIPNAVDPKRFALDPGTREAVRRELAVASDDFLVIYTGSLRTYKGIKTILEAARLRPAYRFLTIGGSPEEIADWRAISADCPNLDMRPFIPNRELPGYLAAADACLVPNSASDRTAAWTFSLKLYEYLAAGKAVVASDIPSLRAAVAGGNLALLVPPDDPDALAAALDRLRREPLLAATLRTAGRRTVAELTWAHRARRILDTFAPELIQGSTP
jgi:glycosyltransferase involved in cell wall biosynthesis